jgi:heme A synthase
VRNAYKYLAYVIAGLVMLQAASMAWAVSGLVKFLGEGGTIDFESAEAPPFTEALGIMIHAMGGMYLIPLLSLILLGVAFAAKLPGGVKWAAIVFGLVVVQVALGILGHSLTAMAFVHGLNALLLFGAALVAARRASVVATEAPAARAAVPTS